ncbi:MAG: hypothetical protein ACI9UT_002016 [Flavobacteriales bacterium]
MASCVAVDAGDGRFMIPAGTVLDMTQVGLMQTAALYTNFHTSENPGGEICGQITLRF